MLLEIKVELWMDNKPSLSFKGRGLFVGEGEVVIWKMSWVGRFARFKKKKERGSVEMKKVGGCAAFENNIKSNRVFVYLGRIFEQTVFWPLLQKIE